MPHPGNGGAGGLIGTQHVQTQPPDGYTLLVTVSTTHAIVPHLQAGRLRLPWFGVFAPAGTPLPLREKFADVAQQLARSPQAGARVAERGFIPVGASPAAFEAEWRASYTAFGNPVRKTGIRVDG